MVILRARTKRSVQVRPGRYYRAMSTWVEPQKIHILITGAKSCVNRWVAAFLRKLPALTRSLCARTPHFCPSRRDRILFFFFQPRRLINRGSTLCNILNATRYFNYASSRCRQRRVDDIDEIIREVAREINR